MTMPYALVAGWRPSFGSQANMNLRNLRCTIDGCLAVLQHLTWQGTFVTAYIALLLGWGTFRCDKTARMPQGKHLFATCAQAIWLCMPCPHHASVWDIPLHSQRQLWALHVSCLRPALKRRNACRIIQCILAVIWMTAWQLRPQTCREEPWQRADLDRPWPPSSCRPLNDWCHPESLAS